MLLSPSLPSVFMSAHFVCQPQGSLRHLGRAAQHLSDLCNVLIAAERPNVDLSDENLAHLQPTSALVRCSMLDLMLAHIDLSEPMLTYMTYHTR